MVIKKNPAVTKEIQKTLYLKKPLTSAKRIIYQNFRYNATYPTVLETKP